MLLLWMTALARPIEEAPRHIVGGEAERGFPAALLLSDGSFLCTASLIEPKVALTAAHCLDGVYAAEGTLTLFDDAQEPLTWVVDFAVHPSYDRRESSKRAFSSADVAVLRLMYPLSVEPVPYLDGDLPEEDDGEQTWAVGYGKTDPNNSNSTGLKHAGQVDLGFVFGDTLVGVAGPAHVCDGDSGGPLYHLGSEGLVQWGIASRSDCEFASTWVRTDVYAGWIAQASERLARRNGDCSHVPASGWGAVTLLWLWRRRAAVPLLVGCTTPCGELDRVIVRRINECDLGVADRAEVSGPSWCDPTSASQAECLAGCWEAAPCRALRDEEDFSLSNCQIDCFGAADTSF